MVRKGLWKGLGTIGRSLVWLVLAIGLWVVGHDLGWGRSASIATATTPQTRPAIDRPVAQAKRDLARSLLTELAIDQRYNLYAGNAIDLATSPGQKAPFLNWLKALLIQNAGWHTIQSHYLRAIEAEFSEAELAALHDLAKNPLLYRLWQAEAAGYVDSGDDRRLIFFRFWDDYNMGKFEPPANVIQP